MAEPEEAPAVPPTDYGGDERSGYFVAGGLLVFLGWGLGVFVNLALHYFAPAAGFHFAGMWFSPTMGSYAWAALGFGLVTGAVGVGLFLVARATPRGRLVLPGVDY